MSKRRGKYIKKERWWERDITGKLKIENNRYIAERGREGKQMECKRKRKTRQKETEKCNQQMWKLV